MNLIVLILLMVFALALIVRVAASAARFGLTLLTVFLVLLGGVAVWRLSAMPSPVLKAYSAESTPTVQVRAKKTSKTTPAPAAREELLAEEPDENAISLRGEPGKVTKPKRPAWVDGEPVQVGDAYQVSVSSGPQEKLAECPPALDLQLKKAVAAYIDDYFEPETAGSCRVSDIIWYDLGYIKKYLVKRGNTFEEKLQMSFGPMYQTHVLLEFGPKFRKDLEDRRVALKNYARERAIAIRLRGLALGFGAVLCLLTVVYGYFRLDTATRGYYTGRLQFLAATAILIAIVAGALLASRVMWM
jgi:uncharacterized integral membrane protein